MFHQNQYSMHLSSRNFNKDQTMISRLRRYLTILTVLLATEFSIAQEPKPKSDPWEATIRKFEESDRTQAPPTEANVFTGSSSIRMWKLDAGISGHTCLNRGFGGSQMADAARYVERIVIPYKPKVVVLYSGDNDIASAKTPEAVRDAYRLFRDTLHDKLPQTRLVLISIKPCGSRWKLREKILEANRLLREETLKGANQVFIDVWPAMLGEDGLPREDLFLKDRLHMNQTGYEIWNKLVEPHLQ